ncbi:contact-dependent growth inhibition system immunity protein [Nocardia tenerifensis]|nr:contact-dependent growth inhibition system immunity protein [Nocardia tenerifensis]
MRSVEDVEGVAWGASPPETTHLIRRVHELRRVPVSEFGVEDLRIMLSQSVGTAVLLPRALEVLERDPLASGDFYPGDLLVAVLRLGSEHWSADSALLDRARRVAQRADALIVEPEDAGISEIRRAVNGFLSEPKKGT